MNNVGNIGVGKAPAHFQHRTDAFKKNSTALDRHIVRSGHDDFQLRVGQGNHTGMMLQTRPACKRPLLTMRSGLISAAMSESPKPRQPSAASAMIGLGGHKRIDPDVLRSRVQEREQRAASDTRTEAARWLGDPPPSQSALAQHTAAKPR